MTPTACGDAGVPLRSRIVFGFDLGLTTFGYAAVRFKQDGTFDILCAGTILHSGNSEIGHKTESFKSQAGKARRSRNRFEHLRVSRAKLSGVLTAHGYPRADGSTIKRACRIVGGDVWDVRAALADARWADEQERKTLISAALLSQINRRGFRNPFASAAGIWWAADKGQRSAALTQAYARGEKLAPGSSAGGTATPAQLVCAVRAGADAGTPISVDVLPLKLQKVHQSVLRAERALAKWEQDAAAGKKVRARPTPPALDDAIAAKVRQVADGKETGAAKEAAYLQHRNDTNIFPAALHRSDIIAEWMRIARMQGIDEDLMRTLGDVIIEQGDPRPAAHERVADDDLPRLEGQPESRPRAPKSHPTFQRFRIVAAIANVRTGREKGTALSSAQKAAAVSMLASWHEDDDPTWGEVAEAVGAARLYVDDMGKPPTDTVRRALLTAGKEIPALRRFLLDPEVDACPRLQEILVGRISGTLLHDGNDSDHTRVQGWLDTLGEEEISRVMDKVSLESGRAAHCVQNLELLTGYMIEHGADLHAARTAVFGTPPDWRPVPDPLGTTVGNPVVDANITLLRKVFGDLSREFGKPAEVCVETTRDLTNSLDTAADQHRRNTRRRDALKAALDGLVEGTPTRDARTKAQLLAEQGSICLYCGTAIAMGAMDVDHMLPRSRGGRSTRMNLAGTCVACNKAKSDRTIAEWAKTGECSLKQIRERIDTMTPIAVGGNECRSWRARYKKSLTAVEADTATENFGWAATAVKRQLEGVVGVGRVHLVPGRMTSQARRMAHIDTDKPKENLKDSGPLLVRWPQDLVADGESQPRGAKARLDRRHHAIDAVLVALLHDVSARSVFSERNAMKQAEEATGEAQAAYRAGRKPGWETYTGADGQAVRFRELRANLNAARGLLADMVAADEIPVTRVRRFGVSTAGIHNETVQKLDLVRLGDALTAEQISRAGSKALWTALTRQPDYHPRKGLPANPDRTITVNGAVFGPVDQIGLFGKRGGALAARGGWVEASGLHHVRVYKGPKGRPVPVFVCTVDALELRDSAKFVKADPCVHVLQAPLRPHMFAVRQGSAACHVACDPEAAFQVLVPGDEIIIDRDKAAAMTSAQAACMAEHFAAHGAVHLQLAGKSADSLLLKPWGLAPEGAPKTAWTAKMGGARERYSVSALTGARVIRRTLTEHTRWFGPPLFDSFVIGDWG